MFVIFGSMIEDRCFENYIIQYLFVAAYCFFSLILCLVICQTASLFIASYIITLLPPHYIFYSMLPPSRCSLWGLLKYKEANCVSIRWWHFKWGNIGQVTFHHYSTLCHNVNKESSSLSTHFLTYNFVAMVSHVSWACFL